MQTPVDPQYVVVCDSCGRSFAGASPRQAEGCSAEIEGDVVTIRQKPGMPLSGALAIQRDLVPDGLANGVICDRCLIALERTGALTAVDRIRS